VPTIFSIAKPGEKGKNFLLWRDIYSLVTLFKDTPDAEELESFNHETRILVDQCEVFWERKSLKIPPEPIQGIGKRS
jgi:hypothetical protein